MHTQLNREWQRNREHTDYRHTRTQTRTRTHKAHNAYWSKSVINLWLCVNAHVKRTCVCTLLGFLCIQSGKNVCMRVRSCMCLHRYSVCVRTFIRQCRCFELKSRQTYNRIFDRDRMSKAHIHSYVRTARRDTEWNCTVDGKWERVGLCSCVANSCGHVCDVYEHTHTHRMRVSHTHSNKGGSSNKYKLPLYVFVFTAYLAMKREKKNARTHKCTNQSEYTAAAHTFSGNGFSESATH